MHEKLNALTHRLFEVDCERQNLQARLARLDDAYAQIENDIFFLRPLYELETLEFNDLVLVLGPRAANAMTKDQYEKLLTEDIAV